ncbi:MAG: hypothetical protein ACREF7_03950 [Candidatus Saccharimonadales bacterium]
MERFEENAYRGVYELVSNSEGPISATVLSQEVDSEEHARDFSSLGETPRRKALVILLADLVQQRALESTPEGLIIPKRASSLDEALDDLKKTGLIRV